MTTDCNSMREHILRGKAKEHQAKPTGRGITSGKIAESDKIDTRKQSAAAAGSGLFDFRAMTGNLGGPLCLSELDATVMFAARAEKPGLKIAATPTKFPSRTWLPSLRLWIDGRKTKPAEPSEPNRQSRETSTASRNRQFGNPSVNCSPEPTGHHRHRWIRPALRIGFTMATDRDGLRSNEHRAHRRGMPSDGTQGHAGSCDALSAERGGNGAAVALGWNGWARKGSLSTF